MHGRTHSDSATATAPSAPRGSGEAIDPFYRALRAIGRFWVWFFFKRVDVRHLERVPAHGPTLLCSNHPNNLIDSLVLGIAMPRKVHYMATAALFRNPLMARFLHGAG